MEKPYIPYDLAVQLKAKGFDRNCIYHYKVSSVNTDQHTKTPTFEVKTPFGANHNVLPTRVSAPLWSEVCDWIYVKSENGTIVNYNPSYPLEFMVGEIENAIKRW